jgi:hypothetical protein
MAERNARCDGERSIWCRAVALGSTMIIAVTWLPLSGSAQSSEGILLREAVRRGSTSRVRIELKAQGLYRPGLPPEKVSGESRLPKPRSLDVQTRLIFSERVLDFEEDSTPGAEKDSRTRRSDGRTSRGRPRKVVRHVIQAAAAINGEVRPFATILRPEVSLLVAERRRQNGPVVVVSPTGPLTRPELEVVQAIGDPLALSDVLPGGTVGIGQHWRVGPLAAQTVSGYDLITANELDASLQSIDRAKVRIQLHGRIEGSANGGKGLITCEGTVTFDRQVGWIDRLEVNRAEVRSPGPVEMGLDVKSTLTMTRQDDPPPATLSDAGLAGLPLEITPANQRLLLVTPDGTATLVHDRHWYSYWDDPKLSVLKRIEGGQVVAQCNISVGRGAGRGRHQDPTQFRDEVRRALKGRFVQFLGAGEVDGDPAGGYRYKVGIQGRDGDLGIVWYYYLVASPDGDQLVAVFTLTDRYAQAFGDQDVAMIGTLRWNRSSPISAR